MSQKWYKIQTWDSEIQEVEIERVGTNYIWVIDPAYDKPLKMRIDDGSTAFYPERDEAVAGLQSKLQNAVARSEQQVANAQARLVKSQARLQVFTDRYGGKQ